MMVGCGIYFGFRGVKEHVALRQDDWHTGVFGPDEPYPGKTYVGIGVLVTDKKQKVTTYDSYLRDTNDIMKIPLLDKNDKNDFAGSILRYLCLLEDDQVRMYCYEKKSACDTKVFRYPYLKKRPIGKDPVNAMMKEAADQMGLDMTHFRGGHAFRRYFISGMVNDKNVPMQESMKAARHTSVSAHMSYMQSNSHTAAARINHLLERNAAPYENGKQPNYGKKSGAKSVAEEDPENCRVKDQKSGVSRSVASPHAYADEVLFVDDGSEGDAKVQPPPS